MIILLTEKYNVHLHYVLSEGDLNILNRLILIAPLSCTPFLCEASFYTINIGHLRTLSIGTHLAYND